jgi:uncharacterized phage protein gp47/JayE
LTSSVPRPTFGPTGFLTPPESAIVEGVFADINAAFGGGLNPAPETPQGQLSVSLGAAIGFCYDSVVALFNQFDPAYATGRMQDALGRIYFLERNPAEPTAVTATCTGAPGTVIPVGSLAKAADGNTYASLEVGTIPLGGSVAIPFACLTRGPIACPTGSLTTIYRAIPGWDTITNAADGVLGRLVESPAEFEARRAASVALNSVGALGAIKANVLNVSNVLDAYVTENSTATPVTVGGVTIAARSLFVSVAGGADADIAEAIWRKKPPGCGMTGTTTVTVVDDNSGYALPYPTYDIDFTVATPTAIKFLVSIADSPAVPANAEELIQAAIIAAFSGSDGGSRARIGATTFASRFYAPVAMLGSWAQIVSIKIGTTTPTADEVTLDLDLVPTVGAADISVVLA